MLTPPMLLTAEEKYFLIRLLAGYRATQLNENILISKTIKELENDLGMTETQIKTARDSLTMKGLLTRCPFYRNPAKKQGRPREGFNIVPLNIPDDFHPTFQKLSHRDLISILLLWDSSYANVIKQTRESGIGNLSPANRITLSILLAHANLCGVVRNLGHAQLAKLTGLITQDRVDSQLNKLTELGYIYSQIAGVTGKYLFGRQTGAFFLNLWSDNLIYKKSNISFIEFSNNKPDLYKECFWGAVPFTKLVYEEKIAIKNKKVDSYTKSITELKEYLNSLASSQMYYSFKNVTTKNLITDDKIYNFKYYQIEFINNEIWSWVSKFNIFDLSSFFQERHLMDFIQYKINQYASQFLSNFWLKQDFHKSYDDLLYIEKKVFFSDFLPKSYKSDSTDGKETLQDIKIDALKFFIYRLTVDVALFAKSILLDKFDNPQHLFLNDRYEIVSFKHTIVHKSYPHMITKFAIIRYHSRNDVIPIKLHIPNNLS